MQTNVVCVARSLGWRRGFGHTRETFVRCAQKTDRQTRHYMFHNIFQARGAINLAWLSPGRPTKRSMSFPKERASVTSVTTTYSNDSQQELQNMSWNNGFMMSRIEYLENSNKRLVDDNANLKTSLRTTRI